VPGQENSWRLLQSHIVLDRSPRWVIRDDDVLTHHDERIVYSYMQHPGSVAVVAVTIEHHVIMLRQYRQAIRRWSLEVPGGWLDGDDADTDAQRELEDETGAQGGTWSRLGSFFVSNGTSDENVSIHLATGVAITGTTAADSSEFFTLELVPWREALALAQTGRLIDATSSLALLLAAPRLSRVPTAGDGP
jgi:ADP-ribose pyrophosphatase